MTEHQKVRQKESLQKIRPKLNESIMAEQLYKYCWGNNEKRKAMKGRVCRVLGRLKKNSCCIEFIDNGQREIVSRNALRKTNG